MKHTNYTIETRLPAGRDQLVRVLSSAGDVIRVGDVADALSMSRVDAAKRLARWTNQGWLARVGRGAYVSATIDTLGTERLLDDPWLLVPSLFSPAYVAGRTAAEHWDLTEQIFKDVVVVTGRSLRATVLERQGFTFSLKHLRSDKIFGTAPVWRQHTKVLVSDVHRTIVDMLDDPSLGGGIQHVGDCLRAYLKRPDRNNRKLIEYAERLDNRAVFKRLGYLSESVADAKDITGMCRERLSAGLAKLDPALSCPRIISQWHLRVPDTMKPRGTP